VEVLHENSTQDRLSSSGIDRQTKEIVHDRTNKILLRSDDKRLRDVLELNADVGEHGKVGSLHGEAISSEQRLLQGDIANANQVRHIRTASRIAGGGVTGRTVAGSEASRVENLHEVEESSFRQPNSGGTSVDDHIAEKIRSSHIKRCQRRVAQFDVRGIDAEVACVRICDRCEIPSRSRREIGWNAKGETSIVWNSANREIVEQRSGRVLSGSDQRIEDGAGIPRSVVAWTESPNAIDW